MTNAEIIQRDFWETFNTILREKGNPFYITYTMSNEIKRWGAINKRKIWTENMVSVAVYARTQEIKIDIYVEDERTYLGHILNANRDVISRKLSVPAKWCHGEKQPNTLRLRYTLSFAGKTYREAIEKAFPVIMEFISIAKEYGATHFFDDQPTIHTLPNKSKTMISVIHRLFGKGVITDISDGLIYVSFVNSDTKTFSFPSAFLMGHLEFCGDEFKNITLSEKLNFVYAKYSNQN